MISSYELTLLQGTKPIVFEYIEREYPLMDTSVALYDTYKLNIMLSDGLAAIMNDRNDIYNTFSGDLLFFDPSEIHFGRILRQGIHKYIEILIPTEYFPNFTEYHSLFKSDSEGRSNLICPPPKERAALIAIAHKMAFFTTQPENTDDSDLMTLFSELVKISVRLSAQKGSGMIANMPATLERGIDFVKKEFASDIKITDMAAAAGCSTSYLSRTFKKQLGRSPYAYLTEYRLFAAEKLLRNGATVTDAALLSGFGDSSSFIKAFKRSFGITPKKYKKDALP